MQFIWWPVYIICLYIHLEMNTFAIISKKVKLFPLFYLQLWLSILHYLWDSLSKCSLVTCCCLPAMWRIVLHRLCRVVDLLIISKYVHVYVKAVVNSAFFLNCINIFIQNIIQIFHVIVVNMQEYFPEVTWFAWMWYIAQHQRRRAI